MAGTRINRWTPESTSSAVSRFQELKKAQQLFPSLTTSAAVTALDNLKSALKPPAESINLVATKVLEQQLGESTTQTWNNINESWNSFGAQTPTNKDEAGVDFSKVVRPIVEVAGDLRLQRQQLGRGSLFEDAPDTVEEFDIHDRRRGHEQDYVYGNVTELLPGQVRPGTHIFVDGEYVSGGGGIWSYYLSPASLPVHVGDIRMAPVAPYGGRRGIHLRRYRINAISVGHGGEGFAKTIL